MLVAPERFPLPTNAGSRGNSVDKLRNTAVPQGGRLPDGFTRFSVTPIAPLMQSAPEWFPSSRRRLRSTAVLLFLRVAPCDRQIDGAGALAKLDEEGFLHVLHWHALDGGDHVPLLQAMAFPAVIGDHH